MNGRVATQHQQLLLVAARFLVREKGETMSFFKKLEDDVTLANRKIFEVASLLIYPLTLVVLYEVFMRYVLLHPTNWVYDMTWMLFGAFAFLGGANTLTEGGHVKADIILDLLPPKGKAVFNIFCYVIFFFPLCIGLCYSCLNYFISSYTMQDCSSYTSWQPLLWPSKLILLISFVMLLIQGIVEFCKAIQPLFSKSGSGGEEA